MKQWQKAAKRMTNEGKTNEITKSLRTHIVEAIKTMSVLSVINIKKGKKQFEKDRAPI